MTQPRAWQVKDQTVRYSPLTGTDAALIGLGNSVQTFQDPTYFTAFLGSTVTNAVGGAELNSPAFLQGFVQGPFNVAANAQISVTIPGVNSGAPVTVTFLIGDLVTLGGSTVLTTSRAADRINTTLASVGVTFLVATNFNGYLRLESANGSVATVGANASITIKDITAGTLANLGFGIVSSATATGVNGPTRGIVTVAPDGAGGYVPLRFADGSPCTTQVGARINLVNGQISVPDVEPGDKIYGKLIYTPATPPGVVPSAPQTLTLNYRYTGNLQASVVTHSGNFSALSGIDTLSIGLYDPVLLASYSLSTVSVNVNFTTISTATDVVNAVNAAYFAAMEGLPGNAGYGAGRAVVVSRTPGPYPFDIPNVFTTANTFNISVNGGAPTLVTLSGPLTVAGVVTAINAVIGAGATASSTTDANSNTILAIATNTPLSAASTISITPGTGGDMRALDKLGIAPGLYKAGAICQLYGKDEVKLFNPSKTAGAQLQLSGSSGTMARLGLTGTLVTATVGIGEDTAVCPNVLAQAIIPEVMEFGEIPPNYDDLVQHFLAPSRPAAPKPSSGLGNASLPPVLGPDGKLDSAFIAKIADYLNVDRVVLGARLTTNPSDLVSPRIIPAFATAGGSYLLLIDVPDTSGSAARLRIYAKSGSTLGGIVSQSVIVTTNAGYVGNTGLWQKDTSGAEASYLQLGPSGRTHYKYVRTTDPASFAEGAWIDPMQADPSGSAGGAAAFLNLGTGGAAELTRGDNLIPRIATKGVGDGVSMTLVWQSQSGASPGYRLYAINGNVAVGPGAGINVGGGQILTVNASWTGSAWTKDVTGYSATGLFMDGENTYLLWRSAVNNANWTNSTFTTTGAGSQGLGTVTVANWDQSPIFFSGTSQAAILSGTAILGAQLPLTAVGRSTPRLFVQSDFSASTLRTLVAKFGGGQGANTYVYRGFSFAGSNGSISSNAIPGAVDCTFIATNCYWDGTQWNKEQTYFNADATLTVYSTIGVHVFNKRGGLTWGDSSWNMVTDATHLGTRALYTDDPNNAAATANVVGPANTIKAWGSFWLGGGAFGQFLDTWNVSSISCDATYAYVNLYAAVTNTIGANYSVICSPFLQSGGGGGNPVPTPIKVSGAANTNAQARISFYDTTNALINPTAPGSSFGCSFVILGRQ